jgi:hypothetical protein
MENLMRLAAAFKYEDMKSRSSADDSFRMTALLSAIKPATLKVLIVSLGFHTCYLILRVVVRKDRPLAINAYYGFNTSGSPIYEMINLSQVSVYFSCIFLTDTKHQLPTAYAYASCSGEVLETLSSEYRRAESSREHKKFADNFTVAFLIFAVECENSFLVKKNPKIYPSIRGQS